MSSSIKSLIVGQLVLIAQVYTFLSPEQSIQTCFTSGNRPAVCVDQSLCRVSNNQNIYTQSNCSEINQVCCPVANEDEHTDAFIVPRWDWAEWLANWTNPNPKPSTQKPVVHLPPYPSGAMPSQVGVGQGNNATTGAPPSTDSSSAGQTPSTGPTSCGVRHNVNIKDIEDLDKLGYIVGGNVAPANSWPWMGAVYSNGRFICGAAVIDQRYVLCAAHCVSHSGRITRAENIQVQIGAHDRRGSGQYFKVEKIIVHSGYNERIMQNDISMFKLANPISYNKNMGPVCLPPTPNSCPDSTKMMAHLAGWGTMSAGGMTSNELREVSVPTIPMKDCQRAYDSNMVTSKQICAGYLGQGGKDTCQGDSGGPMVVRLDNKANQYFQCGIVSWGRGCAEAKYPGVYTRVSEYLEWIKANKV